MAIRRMFSTRIVSSTRFIKMPATSQNLYFHLGMNADDDGIVEAYPIMCTIGASEDDLKVLLSKGFVTVLNNDMVTFVNDWLEHNNIRADRKTDSIYKELLLKVLPDVEIRESKNRNYSKMKTICQTNDGQMTGIRQPNDRLGKDRLGKDRLGKDKKNNKELFYSENEELNNSILSFIDFRKKMKAPMTDHAINLLVNKLKNLSSDTNEQIEILEQSIVNGWKGVFPLKKHEQQKGDERPTYGEEYESADFYTLEFYDRFKTDK